jgi:hypothetical protein
MIKSSSNSWTEKEIKKLKKLYPFYSNRELSQIFSRSSESIRWKGRTLNLVKDTETLRRVSSECCRKYTLNENYFENIDTPDKAYILGFLLGDGCICKNGFQLSISLHKKDVEILNYIKEQLNADAPIKKEKNVNKVYLRVFSYKLINDLAKWNMLPLKTYTLELPDIQENLQSHFIRGLFDADGCISVRPSNRTGYGKFCYELNMRGTKEELEKVNEIVDAQVDIGKKVVYHDGWWPIWRLNGRIQISKVAKWLYQDAPFYLSRKYNKFTEAGLL